MSGKIDDRTLINLLRLRIAYDDWQRLGKDFPKRIYGLDRRQTNFRNLIAVRWARYNPENRLNVIITRMGREYLEDLDKAANALYKDES
jgi:hypothetical protein